MNAIDFIQKFGWDFAIAFSNKGEQLIEARPYEIGRGFIDELKRYVDAYELVQRFGGIHMAKADSSDLDGFEKTSPYWVKVKQAITLVEEVENYNEKTKEGDPS